MNHAESSPLQNIILIGFMGSGKSTIGKELHARIGYPLIDTDTEIELRQGKSISTIFEELGEEAFRNMESDLIEELAHQSNKPCIISTGGGTVIRPKNRELLRQLGFVVWLHAPTDIVLQRTAKSTDRPLLQMPNKTKVINDLLKNRRPWYDETSHLKVDTSGLEAHEICIGILESARYFFSQQ